MTTTTPIPGEPFDPRHHITAKELDRDLLNLHLPEIDLIATEQECEAMYPPGVYQQMIKEIARREEVLQSADASQ